MAAKNIRPDSSAYVYGNTARVQAMGQAHSGENLQKRYKTAKPRRDTGYQHSVSRTVKRKQEKALQMDLPYVVALTIAACCALYICVSYLQIQSSINGRIHNIQVLEQKLELLKSENDALHTKIKTDIDLDHVYKIATEELGMVYANRDQVLLYDKTESEYVRQYEDIPED